MLTMRLLYDYNIVRLLQKVRYKLMKLRIAFNKDNLIETSIYDTTSWIRKE